MKTLVLTLLLVTGTRAMALSDFDRAVLFASNGVSMGTYIAQMEGEIARIKLNYEKKFAEFQRNQETDYQSYLKESLKIEIEYLNSQKSEYVNLLESTQKRNEGFDKVVELTQAVYKRRLQKEAFLEQLQKLNEVYPDSAADWLDLMQRSLENAGSENLSAEQYEQIFFRTLFVQSEAQAVTRDIKNQINSLEIQIIKTETELKALP